jgi:hypothetical protein
MQNKDHMTQTTSQAAAQYDEGLRKHFIGVYNSMSIGLAVTGVTAYLVSNIAPLAELLYTTPLAFVLMFAPLAFLWFGFSHKAITTKSPAQLKTLFYAFCGVFGLSMGAVFLVYTGTDIARAFFITAGAFAATSIFGYSTKADLSKMGGFLFMGTIGLLLAIIVNLFFQSEMIHFIISGVGVLLYTLWTAFHTQQIKESYNPAYGEEANGKMAIMGALSLYIDFMMMFQFILSLIGNRE